MHFFISFWPLFNRDERCRLLYGERYDYRDNLADWDYNAVHVDLVWPFFIFVENYVNVRKKSIAQ